MLRKILFTSLSNIKSFFSIWLFILTINQLIIFGGCFAAYCLLAALPHTLLIALLINFFYRKNKSANHLGRAPGKSDEKKVSHVKPTSGFLHQKNSKKAQHHASPVFLKAPILITAIGLSLLAIFGSFWKSGSASMATPAMTEDEVSSQVGTHGRVLSEESPASNNAHHSGTTQDLGQHIDQNQDEFDINDIETYDRLKKRKTSAYTHHNNVQQHVVEDASLNSDELTENTKTKKSSKFSNNPRESASTPKAYQCRNAVGKVGTGTGRTSQANEYSAFLKREVHADEFVIFRYQGSGKEYWFNVSNCTPL